MKYVWCEIVCSSCSETTAGCFTAKNIPRKQMEKEARAAGWEWRADSETESEDWFCRRCMNVNRLMLEPRP